MFHHPIAGPDYHSYHPYPVPDWDIHHFDYSGEFYGSGESLDCVNYNDEMQYYPNKHQNRQQAYSGYPDRNGFYPPCQMGPYHEFPSPFDPSFMPPPNMRQISSPPNTQSLLHKLESTGRVPSREKFRRMICQTYICCGGCPYNERCVFLHDERIEMKGFKTRPNKQTKSVASPKDSFFWPDMPKEKIYQKLDYLGLPTVNQSYDIPPEFTINPFDYHDRAIYSIWLHFVSFCMKINKFEISSTYPINESCYSFEQLEQTYVDSPFSMDPSPKKTMEDDSKSLANKFIPKVRRLPIFVHLSNVKEEAESKTRYMTEAFPLIDKKLIPAPSPRLARIEDTFIPEEYVPRDFDLLFSADQFP